MCQNQMDQGNGAGHCANITIVHAQAQPLDGRMETDAVPSLGMVLRSAVRATRQVTPRADELDMVCSHGWWRQSVIIDFDRRLTSSKYR